MLPGSKITGVKGYILVNVLGDCTFTMRGGSIEDNLYAAAGSLYLVYIGTSSGKSGKFEMFPGAEIKNNRIYWEGDVLSSNALKGTTFNITTPYSGTVAITGTGEPRFIMHGGAIKNNDLRGVFLSNRGDDGPTTPPVEFIMEGGEISGNGTKEFTMSSTSYYVGGAGIFAETYFKITITGGSIRDNGHENSIGGGMYLNNSASIESVPVSLLIDGSVNFANNAIALGCYSYFATHAIFLGPSFANGDTSPISLEAGYITTSAAPAASTIIGLINNKTILKNPESGGVDLAAAKDSFALTRLFYGRTTTSVATFYPESPIGESAIDNDGKLSVSLAQ
jgi:hypothetical protein